ncbi:MAG: glycerol-3-phosphate 1-O-acyltransferase PlsY [Rhodospirillales bacterium]|nr:glycerol-3-phosphate 1-O-acyltransferase PlsY [Rhodospirillales bacterium]MDE2576567.1 glycerol-3-phosphate 1-O-acyltransferase PlsY [Rhodospirillales bacterium]
MLLPMLLGYLLGAVPFGLLLTRAAGLGDIRHVGSGNIGATNVLRTGKRGLAAATLLLDGGKGAAAVLLGGWLGGIWGAVVAGLAAVLGHLFPVWLGFRGGKGVATGFGVLIALSPVVGLAAGAVWIAMAALLRISSLAALTSFAAAPLLAAWLAPRPVLWLALCVAALIYLRHHANIARLLAGTEPRIGKSH